MNKNKLGIYFLVLFFSLSMTNLKGQTKTVGGTGADYATLKIAFDAINAGTITGAITLQIIDNTAETASAVLNASISPANYTSILIYPTVSGKSISGGFDAPLINLNGADNVTIDGRVNATGTDISMVISNTSTGASASTIQFISSAENNIVKYCTLKGSGTSPTKGIVFFSTATAGNGNDNNKIDNNNITNSADASRPVNAIYSLGSSGFENSGDTIRNNNIYDFLKHGTASHGVFLSSSTTGWTISGNSFYETTSFVPTASVTYQVIRIDNTSGSGFTITGNYIGGRVALCGGSPGWTKTNAFDNIFLGINLNVGSTTVNSIQNNTIQNFAWSNSGAGAWTGIQVVAGAVNIGTTAGNTIGSSTGTGSVTVTGGASGAAVYGTNITSGGIINFQNNTIGSITAANSNSAFASSFYGFCTSGNGAATISNNIIGSTSTAGSIQAGSSSTANIQNVYGIYRSTAGGTLTISNNTIANLTNGSTNTDVASGGLISGITSGNGINTITNNTIHHLTIANANNSSTSTAAVCGIALTGSNQTKTVTGNSIYNLSNTYSSFAGSIIGISFGTTNSLHTISGNFIHSLSVDAASTAASIYGIKIDNGISTYSNNIINLGETTATTIYGIYESGLSTQTCNLYFNSVYIGGSLGSGITNKSYALYSAGSSNTRNFRNNIFENARSTASGSNLHYAAFFNYAVSTSLTLDYNDYYTPGTGGILGYYNSANVTNKPIITGLDAKSLNINPAFASAGGTVAANYIPGSVVLEGTTISTVSTDYALVNRAGTPTIGAYEVTLSLNIDVYKAGAFQASYFRLKDAFDKINNGTHTGALELRIKANTSETASSVLNASGTGSASYTSVYIYPTVSGITITGNLNTHLIDLDGADNVTIDGRVGASGSSKNLVITNTSTGTTATAIRFLNSAQNNTVKYCTLKGSETSPSTGVILFSTSSSGTGNSSNTIDNNDITSDGAGRSMNSIYSYGTVGRENISNVISNNNIFNFMSASGSSNGIHITGNSTGWTISGNSFYETTTLIPTAATTYEPIRIVSSTNHLISGNYVGGSAPLCAGAAFTVSANTAHYFCGIYVNGGAGTPTTVQNNIIQNINYTSVQANPWDGIFISAGNVNVTGNTIGATTGTNSIVITCPDASASVTISGGVVTTFTINGGGSGYTTAPVVSFSTSGSTAPAIVTVSLTDGVVTGYSIVSGGTGYTGTPVVSFDGATYSTSHGMINASTGTVNITGNNIGSITTVGSSTYSHGFESVYVRGNLATTTLSNNLIGSTTTANSINVSSTAATSLQKQDLYGLYSASTGTTTINGNTVANLNNAYAGTNQGSKVRGIQTTAGANTIQNNTVRNISCSSPQTGTRSAAIVTGISQTSATAGANQSLTGNTIYSLSTTAATASNDIYGIYYSGPITGTNSISGNFIHSLALSSTSTNCEMDGIVLVGGLTSIYNNIINIGSGAAIGYKVNGIWDESGPTNSNTIYFNTVYIGGTVSGTTSTTAAIYNKLNTSTRNYRNNILMNARSGGTTGKHYAIWLAGTASLTIDYNDYIVSGTSGMLGRIGTLDKADLATWKTGTGQDANSLSVNPAFVTSPPGAASVNYYATASLPGVSGTGISTDYAGSTRSVSPKMGALESNTYSWKGATSTDFATPTNWTGGVVPPSGANITFDANPDKACYLDQNRTVGDITNAQGTDFLVLNGHQLTITDSLIFSNGAKIDASATASSVVFAGTIAQFIPSGAFVSNTTDALTVNNSSGLSLNGDLSVTQALSLTSGAFSIGANTLSINGTIVSTTGTLSGGSSSNISIGGSGANLTLPAITLNNLTLNRANGASLGGTTNVGGTLALTSGTLTIGANTLTLSGSSPSRTSGAIDVTNVGATLIFANAVSITLPASLFSGAINNLTINNTGGLIAGSDLTINGILNLAAANPSSTRGSLEMTKNYASYPGTTTTEYLDSYILNMGVSATTTGIGDVTGTVKRSTIAASTAYTFGNQFTTLSLSSGTMPDAISLTITIGNTPPGLPSLIYRDGIRRSYEIVPAVPNGFTSAAHLSANFHYLDSELTSSITSYVNTESKIVTWDYDIGGGYPADEHGRAVYDFTNNYIGLSNVPIEYFIILPAHNWRTVFTLRDYAIDHYTWDGSTDSDWGTSSNWTPVGTPADISHVIIPDAATTPNDPILPAGSTTINTLTIENGGILVMNDDTLVIKNTLSGGWEDQNTAGNDPGTSKVVFLNPGATVSGNARFYDVEISTGADISNQTGSTMKIANTITKTGTGKWYADIYGATIDYCGPGPQTVILPDGTPQYHNLTLSGSGTKTLPSSALSLHGNLTLSGTASATAASSLSIGGNLTIESGTSFSTGNYDHTIAGNFDNSGTFNAASGYAMIFNGTTAQSIGGSVSANFDKLTINSLLGVSLNNNDNVSNTLTLSSGNLNVGAYSLGINGSISKTSGFINAVSNSSLSFGGTSAITLPDNLFDATPSLNNLTINRSGGVSLGNQGITVNGLLDLAAGTFTVGGNVLTLAGSSPVRTSGTLDAGNASASLVFTNLSAITLPPSIFSGNVNNLTINSIGGVTASSDFTINGILNLQSVNPSASKGSLDMWDGAAMKVLTMGAAATTTGAGDVTGFVRRASTFIANTPYSFGNQFTTITFSAGGTYPSQIQVKILIGSSPTWNTSAINRMYDFVQTGGSGCITTIATHYLDSELNGISESELVQWTNGTSGFLPAGPYEWGKSNFNYSDNWVAIENVGIGSFPTSFGLLENTLARFASGPSRWNGSVDTNWQNPLNWTPATCPVVLSNVIIPDASTTLNSPTIPATAEIKTLSIEAAGILNSGIGSQLTINGDNGAWNNSGGTFNYLTGKVIFTNAGATVSGSTNFFDIEVPATKALSLSGGSTLQIVGTMTNEGTFNAQASSNFNIQSGGKLIIYPTGKVSSSGTITNNAGVSGLEIQSNASSTGSLILVNSGVSGTTQRYMTCGKWHIISIPVEGQSKSSFVQAPLNNIGYSSSTSEYGMMPYDPANNVWASFFTTSTPGNFTIGEGYMVRRKSIGTDGAVSSAGIMQSGNKSITGLVAAKWNCLGNPYTSAIGVTTSSASTDNFLTVNASNFETNFGAFYIWDEQAAYTGPAQRSDYKVISNNGYLPELSKNYLQTGQGFLVRMAPGKTSMDFTAAMQTHQVSETYLKKAVTSWPGFDLIATSSTLSINTIVTFNDGMTTGLDPTYDAGVLKGNPELSLYTRLVEDNGTGFAIQCLPIAGLDTFIVPVGIDYPSGGQITFTAKTDLIVPGSNVVLEDRITGSFTQLVNNSSGYTVNLPVNSSGIGRFYLHTGEWKSNDTGHGNKDELKVFAFKNIIYIRGKITSGALINLYTTQGSIIKSFTPESSANQQFDAGDLTEGIYLLMIRDTGISKSYKITLGKGW